MLKIERKQDCCGCSACAQICPNHCITMKADEEGFLYPSIDLKECINCNICDKTCPIKNKEKNNEANLQAYVAYNLNEPERLASSSGGIFTLLAKKTLSEGGVVFGAKMSKDCEFVFHEKIVSMNELDSLRGSKYIQSDIRNVYIQAKEELEDGRKVLFSGTPCQIGGLKAYLKRNYETLICVEVVCHGVPSPKLWKKYKIFREKCAGSTVQRTLFRCKSYGWRMYAVLFEFSNGTAYKQTLYRDLFMQMFLQNLCLRPSCYDCHFKDTDSMSDISLADCWGAETICPDLDDDKGLSLVLTHTRKGYEVFESLKSDMFCKSINIEKAIMSNLAIIESCAKPDSRDSFMQDIECLTIEQLGKKYLKKQSLLTKARIWMSINIKKKLRNILKRLT